MLHKPSEPGRSIANHSLVSIHPDETLYSWCAANHAMSCCRNSAATASMLLGAPHAVRQHEFPHSLDMFIALSRTDPTSILEHLRRHTVAGFYLPFLNEQAQKKLVSEAQNPHSAHWMRTVLGTSRTQQAVHPLKWCRHCIRDDMESIGRTIWHTVHQSPIALVCTLHNEPLHWSVLRSKQWRLPHRESHVINDLPETLLQVARSAAALSAHLQKTPLINMTSLRRCTLVRLQEIGVIHSVNGARHDRLAQWFSSTSSSALARIAQPKLTKLISGQTIPGLLWRQKRTNPIPWMFLWSALQWKSSLEAIEYFSDAAAGKAPAVQGQLQLFSDHELERTRTPQYVRDAFEICDSYAEVMKLLCVSRHDVVRWLENDDELRIEWRLRLRSSRQAECVQRFSDFIKNEPRSTRADIENNFSADYRWMREHAPNKLTALVKSLGNRNSVQLQIPV